MWITSVGVQVPVPAVPYATKTRSKAIMKINLDLGKSIKETQNKDCVHIFTVTLDEQQTKDLCLNAVAKLQHVAKIPGFRVGKVPLSMIKNQFPNEIRDEAIDTAAKAALPEIFEQHKDINPVVQPIMRNVKYEEDKSLSFEIQIETPPVFEVKDYTKLKATKKAVNVSDKDVDTYINQVLEYNSYLKSADEKAKVTKKNYIIADYRCVEDGKTVPGSDIKGDIIDMSNPQTIKGLPEAVLGAKKGETKEFMSKLGDKEMKYVVTVSEIKEKVTPALDEEFFKSAGVKDEAELKANVRKMLEDQQSEASEKDMTEQLEDALIKNNPFSLPPTLVAEETADLIQVYKKRMRGADVDEKKAAERLQPVAIRNLSLTYILHAIAKKENITATDEDLNEELKKALETIKTEEEKNNARKLFEERKEYIRASLVENKVIAFVKENATIKEVKERKTRTSKAKAAKAEQEEAPKAE